jgi:hypothetical protein
MAAAAVFKIEDGVLCFKLVGSGDTATWQTPAGEAITSVTPSDYATGGGTFSCQVTSGALTASPNTTDDTTPATFCSPEVTTTNVGVTSYTLDATFLQDLNIDPALSLSRYLFEHDTKLAYFLLGFDGVNPPKAVGKLRLVSGAIGGDARVTLTATVSLPLNNKPDIEFGNATTHTVVMGDGSIPVGP